MSDTPEGTAAMPELNAAPGAALFGSSSASDPESLLAAGFAQRIGTLARLAGASRAAAAVAAGVAAALSRAGAAGHVCLPLAGLQGVAPRVPLAALRALLLGSGVACDGSGDARALLPLVIDADDRAYLARYYDYERQLARALVERMAHGARRLAEQNGAAADAAAGAVALADSLARFFGPRDDAAVDWQRVAAALALSGNLTVISGGPGTGKTTTVVGILACLLARDPGLRIALAAPTGKAAQRMQEALHARAQQLPPELTARLPRTSYTLHRLLGTGTGQGGQHYTRHTRNTPLPYDVVIVDEASMIDLALAARLLDAVPPHARLVLLGDKDQLAAVEAGAVFAELSVRPTLSRARLVEVARALGVVPEKLAAAWPASDAHGARSAWHEQNESGAGDAGSQLVDCVVWLERNYRFGLDSSIGRLAAAIRDGSPQAALAALERDPTSPAAAVLDDDGGSNLAEAATLRLAQGFEAYASALAAVLRAGTASLDELVGGPLGESLHELLHEPLHELQNKLQNERPNELIDASLHESPSAPRGELAALFDALNHYRVLCALRAGPRGVDRLNAVLAEHVRGAAGVAVPPGAVWFAGRAVMVTRNDYALGLFNGDVGIALPAAEGALRVVFRDAHGAYRAVAPAALPAHDTAFALTVHKAQGSEFEQVALVLPTSFNRVLTRELLYTAVTRARRRVALVGASGVLAEAIATPTRRASGLSARIAEAVRARQAGEA